MKKTMIACAALLLMAVHGMAQTEKPLTDEEIAVVRAWMASHPEDGSQKKIQEGTKEDNFYAPHVHGTIRGKWEYQTEENEHRFEVRNARVSLDGNVTRHVSYKAEIDLSEEGEIKMLDAYTRIKPMKNFQFTIGQMRVPFTIDAHRSPAEQYFANRSFIAKQVGNVRDVGATVGYTFQGKYPLTIEGGLFNGSGLTGQKDFWTKSVNYSAKATWKMPAHFTLEGSVQKIEPDKIAILMSDVGLYYETNNFHIEGEYLYKHYDKNAFHGVNAFDFFANYDQWFHSREDDRKLFKKISYLLRCDYMDDHSNGTRVDDGNGNMVLTVNDAKRTRLTGGITLSFAKKGFNADLRINYEKYFYDKDAVAKTSERDKFVIEFMTHF